MSKSSARLGILLSGSGSTYANLVEAIEAGNLPAEIAVVISSRPGVKGLERAAAWGHTTAISKDQDEIQSLLLDHGCDLVAMCGFMRRYDPQGPLRAKSSTSILRFCRPLADRATTVIASTAPSLEKGVRVSGCSVHLVAGDYDTGPLLAQRPVPVLANDAWMPCASGCKQQNAISIHWYCARSSKHRNTWKQWRVPRSVPGCDAWDLGAPIFKS